MDENLIVRSATETANVLRVKGSTLRKYCIALENAGYKFSKSERGHRSFMPDDITILQRLITAKNQNGVTLSQAAGTVVKIYQKDSVTVSDTEGPNDRTPQNAHDNAIAQEQMEQFMEQQQQFNRELLDRLDRQQDYIDKRLNERDQQLMAGIRELQEAKKLEAAAREEEKKKPWWKFW